MTNPFYRLAPFIQEYIYKEKWGELRPVQVQSLEAILDTPNHVLITSGTASGKTEAAFLPILTKLTEQPSRSIGAMYIGPLKALINDQFYRLEGLLEESGIPVQSWHGDVSQSKKDKFLKKAQGVLQITPESLEAMLINRQTELGRLFGDLRFVVIDEVHAFIASDRGRQVLCQLQRLARYQPHPPRRIGLSATLGEPELAMDWLKGGTPFDVTLIKDPIKASRTIMLGLEHFLQADEEDELPSDEEISSNETPVADETTELFQHMYRTVQTAKKTIVFANSRNDTEEVIQNLRQQANREQADEDGYYVHHGSVSPALREQAETDMRNPDKTACIAATVTLELGIDIGNLDQVVQLNATNTVSSFVQRLGRSGRRTGEAAKMFFYCRDRYVDNPSLGEQIPWKLLQTIAIVQLYMETRWIEPPDIPTLPVSLLYHQTMSVITAQTELAPGELAERILSLSPFKAVTFDQYRSLLHHLLANQHLERVEEGGLIIGAEGERIVNNYRFYATFQDESVYMVRNGTREVGSIQTLPAIGDRFRLGGRGWQVVDIDEQRRIIQVDIVKGKAKTHWTGGGAAIHTQILQRMRQILKEDINYGYLESRAVRRLKAARLLARTSGLTSQPILPMGGQQWMLLPWQGTRTMITLQLLLAFMGIRVKDGGPYASYFLMADAPDLDALRAQIRSGLQHIPQPEILIANMPYEALCLNKYDRFVPEELLRSAFASDQLDLTGAVLSLREFIQ